MAKMGSQKRLYQVALFTPVAFFAWVPISFMQQNYSKKLNMVLIGAIGYASLTFFPFFFFQGTRDTEAEQAFSTGVVICHVGLVLCVCVFGVYNNRTNHHLVVVDKPSPAVRVNLRNVPAYETHT